MFKFPIEIELSIYVLFRFQKQQVTNEEEKLEEVAASIVSEASPADVFLVGETHLLMIQNEPEDTVKLVMQ